MDSVSSNTIPREVRLPRQRLRNIATALSAWHTRNVEAVANDRSRDVTRSISVVCISDTHNNQPELPSGDLLLHAGDLTEWGTFEELQSQISWLASQPHRYKVVIAGNHDVLLDPTFLEKYPKYAALHTHTSGSLSETSSSLQPRDLDWGTVKYLNRVSIVLEFPNHSPEESATPRRLKIFGCPLTPQYGMSAFQIPRDQDVWSEAVPEDTDIILTHGPPFKHLDGARGSGCLYLAQEVARVRPKLVVFGHIHVGYGREDIIFDCVRRQYERIICGWAGYPGLITMLLAALWTKFLVLVKVRNQEKVTTLVNAAMVGGDNTKIRNQAVTLKI